MKQISVAKDYSRYPAGRFKSDGPANGEKFRTVYLVPALERSESTTIDLDGTRGYGSSFLEEAFGGLVRLGYSKEQIGSFIKLTSVDGSLIDEIWHYIDVAQSRVTGDDAG